MPRSTQGCQAAKRAGFCLRGSLWLEDIPPPPNIVPHPPSSKGLVEASFEGKPRARDFLERGTTKPCQTIPDLATSVAWPSKSSDISSILAPAASAVSQSEKRKLLKRKISEELAEALAKDAIASTKENSPGTTTVPSTTGKSPEEPMPRRSHPPGFAKGTFLLSLPSHGTIRAASSPRCSITRINNRAISSPRRSIARLNNRATKLTSM